MTADQPTKEFLPDLPFGKIERNEFNLDEHGHVRPDDKGNDDTETGDAA